LLTNQYGKNYPRIALALNNLARVLRNKSRYAESQMMHEAALDILRKIHGENHPHVASALHNLGSILALQHKYSDAIVQVKAALERRRLVFGDNHILVAESLKALGHLYYAEGSFNQARSYLEECLKIRRKINENSGDDYLVATVLNNLGLVLKNMLMYTDAEELLRESLAIRMNLYGASNSQHPAIATAHYTLGILLLAIGRFHNARESLQKSLQARSISFGEVHPLIANTLNALAELAFAEGRQGEATVLMKQAVDMRTILYGSGSAVVVANLHRLISFLRMTSSDAEVAVINKRLVELGETAPPANEAMIALSLLMDSFEEDDDALSPQFLKMDSSMREVNQEGVIQGGPGWVDRLLAYLARSRDSLQEDIQKRMAILHEKKSAVDVREREVGDLKCAISNKELKVKEFESLVVSDKRYIYDLQIALRDKESLVVRLSEKETKSLSDAKVEVKNLEDQFSSVHKQLEVFNGEIKTLGDLNSKQKEAMKQSSVLHDSIQSKLVSIGAIRWRLVGYDGRNEVEVTGGRNDLSALVREKGDLEIDAELHEITIRKIDKELEPYRIKYKVAEVSVAHPLPKSSVLNAEKKPIELVPATTAYAVTDVDVSSDDGNESESGEVSGDESAGNSKRYRKKLKKQAMLIDMLTNQVISLGATPIAEVATLLKAEQKLQNALVRLMEGDEAAAKDFDKWDQFVRNHPDYKRKQIEQKLLWSSLNDPVNVAACHLMRSFVPPDIVVSCTLTSLESKLPKVIARRIWTKKALWLTRISPQKIARLHIADLQTKYSVQGLDEIELRAVYGCLPLNFENDGKGEKLAWKNSIWQSLESKCKTPLPWQATYLENSNYAPSAEELRSFILSLPRHSNYKYCTHDLHPNFNGLS
jgi:tetratricopeptide (TPR) repeat protein